MPWAAAATSAPAASPARQRPPGGGRPQRLFLRRRGVQREQKVAGAVNASVSYTHLTLPTICSV
eukprot:13887382-Alexandrium_andersonii.AAC.1